MDRALKIFNIVFATNLGVFAILSLAIGGDAMNGYVSNEHYFLLGKGFVTEVSSTIYRYSWWHALSVELSAPLFFILNVARYIATKPEPDIRRTLKSFESDQPR